MTKAVVNPGVVVDNNTTPLQLVLFNTDGTAASTIKKQAAQVDSVAASTAAMVVDFNLLLVKLRAAGVIAP
jgi:hypothetical protein